MHALVYHGLVTHRPAMADLPAAHGPFRHSADKGALEVVVAP
jgi:hypothetical protein